MRQECLFRVRQMAWPRRGSDARVALSPNFHQKRRTWRLWPSNSVETVPGTLGGCIPKEEQTSCSLGRRSRKRPIGEIGRDQDTITNLRGGIEGQLEPAWGRLKHLQNRRLDNPVDQSIVFNRANIYLGAGNPRLAALVNRELEGRVETALSPAFMAGLPGSRLSVAVRPPLLVKGPSIGSNGAKA